MSRDTSYVLSAWNDILLFPHRCERIPRRRWCPKRFYDRCPKDPLHDERQRCWGDRSIGRVFWPFYAGFSVRGRSVKGCGQTTVSYGVHILFLMRDVVPTLESRTLFAPLPAHAAGAPRASLIAWPCGKIPLCRWVPSLM